MDEEIKESLLQLLGLVFGGVILVAAIFICLNVIQNLTTEHNSPYCEASCDVLVLEYYSTNGGTCWCIDREGIPAKVPIKRDRVLGGLDV